MSRDRRPRPRRCRARRMVARRRAWRRAAVKGLTPGRGRRRRSARRFRSNRHLRPGRRRMRPGRAAPARTELAAAGMRRSSYRSGLRPPECRTRRRHRHSRMGPPSATRCRTWRRSRNRVGYRRRRTRRSGRLCRRARAAPVSSLHVLRRAGDDNRPNPHRFRGQHRRFRWLGQWSRTVLLTVTAARPIVAA
jgi:hypothetical protein